MLCAFPSSCLHCVRVADNHASLRIDLAGRVRTFLSNFNAQRVFRFAETPAVSDVSVASSTGAT